MGERSMVVCYVWLRGTCSKSTRANEDYELLKKGRRSQGEVRDARSMDRSWYCSLLSISCFGCGFDSGYW